MNSVESENHLLACLLSDDDREQAWSAIDASGLHPDSFYDLRHGAAFAVMQQLRRERKAITIDAVAKTLAKREAFRNTSKVDVIGFLGALEWLPAANAPEWCKDIRGAWIKQSVKAMTQELNKAADNEDLPAEQLTEAAKCTLAAIDRMTGGASGLPPIQDASQLIKQLPPEPPELIAGILHKGSKLILGGGSKTCKTWTLADLAISVACGEPWLSNKVSKGRVLFLNLEIGEPFFARRMEAISKAKTVTITSGCLDVWNLRGFAADWREIVPKILDRVKDTGYDLIVLDPLYKLLGGSDENSAGDMANFMNGLERLASQTGAAVAFASHFSKGNQSGKESIDRVSGSGVLGRDPDAILTMTRHETEGAYVVEMTLRNHKPIDPFVVRWEWPLMRRDSELDPTKLKQPPKGGRTALHTGEDLLAMLKRPLSTKKWLDVATKEHGVSRTVFFKLRKSLADAGQIKETEEGLWEVPKVP